MGVRIPLTNNVSPARGGGVRMNASAMAATSNAMANMGNVISKIGQDQFGNQVKLARIDNAKRISEMKRNMRESAADFQNKIMSDKSISPSEWGDRFNDHIKGASNMGVENLSPEAREEWSMWNADYTSNQQLRISRDATITGIQQAKMEGNNNITEYTRQRDYDSAYEELDSMESSGLITKEKGEQQRQLLMNDQERSTYETMLDTDPKNFLNSLKAKGKEGSDEYIEFEKMPIDQRRRLIKAAEREVSVRRGQDVDYVKDMITTNELKDPTHLDDLRESGQLSYLEEADVMSFKQHLKKDVPATDAEVVGLMVEIDELKTQKGNVSDSEYAKLYRNLENKTMSLTQKGGNGWLKQRLNYINPNYDERSGGNPLLKKGKIEAMDEATKHLGILFKNGDFGEIDNGKTGVDKKYNAESAKVYRDIQRDVEQYVERQTKPVTIEEIHEYMGSAIERLGGEAGVKPLEESNKNKTQRVKYESIDDSVTQLKNLTTGLLLDTNTNHDPELGLLPPFKE